jgi:excinuclease UvrABC nuclease subunit
VEFSPERDSELFAAAPASAAVFVLRGETGSDPYVGKSSNLRRRLQRLLGPPEGQSRKLNLRDRVREVEWWATGSDFEAGLLLYKTLRREFPSTYGDRMRFRFAPLVKLILDNPYPRATVTTRISGRKARRSTDDVTEETIESPQGLKPSRDAALNGTAEAVPLQGRESRSKVGVEYFGPFPTRVAAEKFANDSLDFYKMRRCTDDLNPDPAFPGCIYSEMKMCLAPCFKGCTDEEYAAEVGRVREYFASGGQSLVREIEKMRDEASTALDFEGAAALHTRLEKVKAAMAQLPEIVRRLDELNGVMIQPSAEKNSVTLFKIVAGQICDGVQLDVASKAEAAHMQAKPQSMEARINEALAGVEAPKLHGALEWMEHLALLKRWYYRTMKVGELFLTDGNGELPMRRVVRGVSRVFKGEKAVGDLSETAGDYWRFRAMEGGVGNSKA